MTRAFINVIVYKGSPLDYPQYRHTALWVLFSVDAPPLTVEITGAHGFFAFETRPNLDPSLEKDFAKCIEAGHLTTENDEERIIQQLREVPIDNEDYEYNCHTWVELALRKFRDAGSLSQEAYDRGLNGMVDAIAEAQDVES